MKFFNLALFLSASAPVFATINGPCAGGYNDGYCICLQESTCRSYGGQVITGSPGNYPCPYDANSVKGCKVIPCPGKGEDYNCRFANRCLGRVLSAPICPGGSDFVCCDTN